MKFYERIALYAGIFFTFVGIAISWMLDLILGSILTIFVLGVGIWYFRLKDKGNIFLKELAGLLGCKYKSGGFAYGHVTGLFLNFEIEIRVNRDYNSLRGLGGFALSQALMDSAIGVLSGIKNFTSVKINHNGKLTKTFRQESRLYANDLTILYLPPCNEITGLPLMSAQSLASKIERLIKSRHFLDSA